MKFTFTDEMRMIQEMVRDFAENEIEPMAEQTDQEEKFPEKLIAQMAELGLMGIQFPEKYGGAGMDYRCYALAIEQISRACASTGAIASIHASAACDPIYRYGTEEQKQKYLTPLASGRWLGCFALTEAWSGSDAAALRATAKDDGDHWVINGAKLFVTNAREARICILFASTDLELGHAGINAYIVDMKTPGLTLAQYEKKMGLRGTSTMEIVLEDIMVPKDNLLGGPGRGFEIAMNTLDGGRIGIAAQAVGIGVAALDAAAGYAVVREQFGRPISDFQAIQWKIADMATRLDAARLLTWQAAWLKDQGQRCTKESAMAKLFASEAAMDAATEAVQIHGGYGVIKEYPVERYYRDAKVCEIYEGTSEIQRQVIARNLVKE